MKTLTFTGALLTSLLVATALPVRAADMTHERALNVAKEPHNWLLHHGNYEGWRFSQLKQINTDNVKNLKVAFTVALGGYESGGRYKHGNLQATPIVEDGMMYVTDGWGSVYAIDVSSGKKGLIKWKFDPGTDRAWAGDVACCGVNNRGVALWKDGKERWKHGGASVWETATYDPESDTFYQGIGNAGPDWDPEYRPGDNKWAASVLALSPTDGKIKWGYQYTPNDPYDFDEISEHPLINGKVNGEDRKLVVHAAPNGFFYALDRVNGAFVAGKQYVNELNWTTGRDPKTGKPLNYDPTKDVQIYTVGSHGSRETPD